MADKMREIFGDDSDSDDQGYVLVLKRKINQNRKN